MSKNKNRESTALLYKSSSSLHKTIQPGVTLSSIQKKALNALHYSLQNYVKLNFKSVAVFHSEFEDRIMDFQIRRSHFETLISYYSRNNVHLKDVLRQLSKIQADWTDARFEHEENYEFTNIFLSAGVRNGYVSIKIPPQTRRALVSEHIESTIDVLKISQNLHGKYAISLYELIKGFFERQSVDSNTFTFEIDDYHLRNAINVPYDFDKSGERVFSYPTIGKLNQKVLKPALKELNSAGFEFVANCEFERKGCGAVVWVFEASRTNLPSSAVIANDFATEFAEITKALTKFGVKRIPDILNQIRTERDVMYFEFCIKSVESAIRKKNGVSNKIENLAGYFMASLKSNVEAFDKVYNQRLADRAKETERKRLAENARIQGQKEASIKRQRQQLRLAHLQSTPQETLDQYLAEFIETEPGLTRSHKQLIEDQGVEASPMVRSKWNIFLEGKFGITPKTIEDSLENETIITTFG